MARAAQVKHIRKAGDFSATDLGAGEIGVNTTDKRLNFSTTGSDMVWQEKVTTAASDTTPDPTGDGLSNFYTLTALAGGATFSAPSGTPANGNRLLIRIKDTGTARSLAWNAIYRAIGVTLPTTTVINKTLYVGAVYNGNDSKWDVIATAQEA